MAVYTPLGAEAIALLVARYDIGTLVSAKGIAEGISNSNWLLETAGRDGAGARYILTMYEHRIDAADLPYFLALLDHLSARGCAVPATIHDRTGASLGTVDGKAVALIQYLPGVSPARPSGAQARAVGAALAEVHLAARDFPSRRSDPLHPAANLAVLERLGPVRLAGIDPALPQVLTLANAVTGRWPDDLPRSTIHSDLFPDNVLMLGDRVTGLIDFYFACDGIMAYDLAVTHAAWCFSSDNGAYHADIGHALMAGYDSVRRLRAAERAALPLLAEGACLRFIASRAEDWLSTAPGHYRKDPMDFVRRWRFYRAHGAALFVAS